MESACGSACEGDRCDKCAIKEKTNVQGSPKFEHGYIHDTSYPEHTHIYDSPWYKSNIQSFKAPHTDILKIAQEAQRKARLGLPVSPPNAETRTMIHAHIKEKPAKASKVPTLTEKTSSKETQKKTTRTKSRTTAQEAPITPPICDFLAELVATRIPPSVQRVETMDTPIRIESIRKVRLELSNHEGRAVWIDPETRTTYEYLDGNRIGRQLTDDE
jgi:hypothetical protein